MGKTKEYTNGEVTIVWKPDLCIHSENCVKGLPEVFNTQARPWIDAEGANTQRIIEQVKKCPSGALSTYLNAEGKPTAESDNKATEVQIMKNGPAIVHGEVKIKLTDGSEVEKSGPVAFCRCGHSQKKPFCDGSHLRAGFTG